MFREMSKSIHGVWYHSPIHALHFLSSSKVLAGIGNVLRLYDVIQEKIICTLTLKKFVTIHNIVARKISSKDEFLIGVGGNRFRAGFRLSPEHQLFTLFEDYDCDSVVCSSLEWNGGNSAWFGFLTAHSILSLQEVTCPEGACREAVVTELNPIVCHSGVIITELSVKSPGWVVLAGSTFGKIDIYSSIQEVGGPENDPTFRVGTHSGLSSQKGTVYSLSSCYLPSSHCLRLASAAEDRSVSVWTRQMKTSKPSRTDYIGPWELLFVLNDGGLKSSIIFEARVWKVCVNTCGLLTTGEDCRVVWYPWDSAEGIKIITGAHRGRNIWSCDTLVSDDADYAPLLATGGNDGAICIHLLEPSQTRGVHEFSRIFSSERLTLQEMTDVHSSTIQENDCTSNPADFPRCMFFGPTGRMFYLTDRGYIYTCEFDPVTNTVGNQTRVEVLFWPRSFLDINTNQCEVKSHANEVFLADQLLSAVSPFWCLKVFHGYITCSTSACHHLVAIGDRQGRVGLFELFDEKPFMVCTCLFDLGQKVMKLIWVSATQLLVGLQNKPAVVFTLQNAGSLKAFYGVTAYLQLPPGPEMRWVNAGICVPIQQTSACFDSEVDTEKVVSSFLVLGTRDGGLYTFHLPPAVKGTSIRHPSWSLETCHGHGGCTAVTLLPRTAHPPIILSAGRTHGEIRRWALRVNGSLVLLGVIPNSENLTWVDRFYTASDGRLFALGFQSVNFKVYKLTDGSDLHFTTEFLTNNSSPSFTVNCAGGNRCWDLWIASPGFADRRKLIVENEGSTDAQAYVEEICAPQCDGETALLAVINRRGVTIHGDRLKHHHLTGRSDEVVRLEPSLHGRDVNCCLLFTGPCRSGSLGRKRTFFCLAGSEDTLLSSWSLQLDEKNVVSSSTPEHHRGQISNIRCMTTPLQVGSKRGIINHSFTDSYLLTGGGRGQIGLWRLGFGLSDSSKDYLVSATVDLWHPGWLGSIRLRHIEAAPLNGSGGCESADLRVMSIVCVQPEFNMHSQVWLFALAGCSDGSVRLITILPPCSSFPKSPKFTELGAIDEFLSKTPSGYTPSCCLDLQVVDIGEGELVVASTNSRGEVICWCVHWSPASTSDPDRVHWSVEQLWTLINEPIPPYYIQTSPAMCCLAVRTKPVSETKIHYFAVGGDDGSLRLASARSNNCGPGRPQWLASGVHHYATTLRACFLTSASCQHTSFLNLLTLGADQRVVQWVFDTSKLILSAARRSMIPGLGDPHDFACVQSIVPVVRELEDTCGEQVEDDSTFVLVAGMGMCLLRIS